MSEVSPGMEVLLGRLRLRVVRSAATFDLDPEHPTVSGAGIHPTVVEIGFPGATIGRGNSADLRLVGGASADVSRSHLLVQASGRQWTVTDCGSGNHTFEEDDESGSWRQLPADFPIPVLDGMTLCLGSELLLRFELLRLPVEGKTTERGSGAPRAARERIRPAALEHAAAALLARRRADPRDRSVPTTAEWAKDLDVAPATAYRRREALMGLEEVSSLLQGTSELDLAEALARAFPYLLASSINTPQSAG